MERFYYKNKDGSGFLNLKSPCYDERYEQITQAEFEELTKPKVYELTDEQKAEQEKNKSIQEYKKYLQDTDYIVLKIAERLAEGDSSSVSQLQDIYKEQLKERKRIRSLLN